MKSTANEQTVPVIGIVGGVASGKSLVADQLRQLGAEILDADRAGHRALRDADVKKTLQQRWGDAVLDPHGEIDRAAVAKIVFAPPPAGPAELAFLEKTTHPKIEQYLREENVNLVAQGVPAIALDAALIFEAGWDVFCDKIIFVDVPRTAREARAVKRGWTAEDFAAREASQMPVEEKKARADFILDNSGPTEHTFQQVRQFWHAHVADK